MERLSVERRVVMVFPKNIFPASLSEKAELFELFRNRFDLPHCPLPFSTFTFFYKRVERIQLLFA